MELASPKPLPKKGVDEEQVMAMMQAAKVAAGIVQTGEDTVDKDSHLRERKYLQMLDCQEIGSCPHARPSVILSKTPSTLQHAPSLGEHTEYVCTNLLKLSDNEFVELLQAGVFE